MLGFGTFWIARTYLKVAEAQGWPTTEGVVLNRDWQSVRWVSRTSSGYRYVPEIRYRYTVAGQTFVSENVYPSTPEQWSSHVELNAFMDTEFPRRGRVIVSYDPDRPDRAAIILRGEYGTAITFAICGIVALFGRWTLGVGTGRSAGGPEEAA